MAANRKVTWINLTPKLRLRQDSYCYSVERLRMAKDRVTGKRELAWVSEGKYYPNLEQALKYIVAREESLLSEGEEIDLMTKLERLWEIQKNLQESSVKLNQLLEESGKPPLKVSETS